MSPTIRYTNCKGEKLSGNTTILGGNLGWKTAPLMIWKERQCVGTAIEVYNEMGGTNPDSFSKALREGVKAKSDEAPTAGTALHYMVECDLLKTKPDLIQYSPEVIGLAENSFLNYLQWRDSVNLEVIEVEPHIVSEKYQFGTTPDCIAKIKGLPSLFEWKAGGIYEDYLCQLSAQKVAWEEVHPEKPLTGGFHLLEINKESAAFTHHWWQSLPEAWLCFEACLKLHNLRKVLKKQL